MLWGCIDRPLSDGKMGYRGAVAHELECLGFIAQAEGLPERAVRLLGAAESLRETCNDPMATSERIEHDQHVAALSHLLDAAAFDHNWQAGRSMTMDEAISFGIAPPPSRRRQPGRIFGRLHDNCRHHWLNHSANGSRKSSN